MEKYRFSTTENNINLLDCQDNRQPKGKKVFKISKFITYLLIILIIAFFIFTYQIIFTGTSITNNNGALGFFQQLTSIAKGSEQLSGLNDDRVNILLLGNGGTGHDGPNLTDTIIVASIQPSTNKIAMISIPRDLLVEIPQKGWWKINNAYHFGTVDDNTTGGDLSKQVVSEITGLSIPYYLRVDFSGFEQLIDELGGIKINVERSFTDYQYPTDNHKYQVVSFEKGWQTMDGDTALKYVRSRHGNNGEGSDFARSKRQQQVLLAIKERVLSVNTLLNFRKVNKLVKTLEDHIDTNLQISEIIELAKMSKTLDTQNIINVVLDDSAGGYLYPTMVNEAYVLRPKGDDFYQIQLMAKNIFATQHTISQKQTANLEIKNGTDVDGLAYRTSLNLKNLGFKVIKIGNAPTQDYSQTLIYDLTEDKEPQAVASLSNKLQATVIKDIPDWIAQDADFSTDYYIILGANFAHEG